MLSKELGWAAMVRGENGAVGVGVADEAGLVEGMAVGTVGRWWVVSCC